MKTLLTKKELRIKALKKRKTLVSDSISCNVTLKILNSKEFLEAKNIALYYPIKNEIDITGIVKTTGKNFYFPRCNNLELEFCAYNSFDAFLEGSFGIKEPMGECINPKILDIIYIPALMANKLCYRLGYGKGYYDRFFRKNDIKAKKILVVPFELITEEFMQDDFDIPADLILCEK